MRRKDLESELLLICITNANELWMEKSLTFGAPKKCKWRKILHENWHWNFFKCIFFFLKQVFFISFQHVLICIYLGMLLFISASNNKEYFFPLIDTLTFSSFLTDMFIVNRFHQSNIFDQIHFAVGSIFQQRKHRVKILIGKKMILFWATIHCVISLM